MYTKIKDINDVRPPVELNKGDVFYLKGNSRKNKKIIKNLNSISNEGSGDFIIIEDKIIAFFWDIGVVVFDLNGKELKKFANCSLILKSYLNLFIIKDDKNGKYLLVDSLDLKIKSELNSSYSLLHNNLGLKILNNVTICADSINNGKRMWEYDICSTYNENKISQIKFHKFLGITNEKLFILTDRSDLVIINILDGHLIKILNNDEISLNKEAFMHPITKHIYNLASFFVKLNTETLEVEIKKKIVQEKTYNNPSPILYGIKKSSLQGEYISFTSFTKERSGFAKWIGLYDYTKEELVWHHELLPAEGQLSIPAFEYPKLADNKLYILDTENTLHVFEKSSNELA